MSSAPIVDRIRIIPRPNDFLDRNVGSSGEVFFNRATNSLRVYSGKDVSGFEIARADLTNVDTSNLNITNDDINWIVYDTLDDLPSAIDNPGMFAYVDATGRAYYAHAGNWIPLAKLDEISGPGGGASVDVSDTVPTDPASGNLWLDTNTGKLYIYYDDGDTAQWIQPSSAGGGTASDATTLEGESGAYYLNYTNFTNTPTIPSTILDLGIADGTLGQVLSTDGAGNFTFATVSASGAETDTFATVTARGATTNDAVTINNTLTVDDLATGGAGVPVITSASTLTLTAPDGVVINGLTTVQATNEVLDPKTSATGTVTHDLDTAAVFHHSNISADFTANFTNVATTDDRTTSVALILVQGATAYMPTAVQIAGAAQTILWQGGSAPSGTNSGIDIVSFTLIRENTSWAVIGSGTSYS